MERLPVYDAYIQFSRGLVVDFLRLPIIVSSSSHLLVLAVQVLQLLGLNPLHRLVTLHLREPVGVLLVIGRKRQ